jgi:hypothetical protein
MAHFKKSKLRMFGKYMSESLDDDSEAKEESTEERGKLMDRIPRAIYER